MVAIGGSFSCFSATAHAATFTHVDQRGITITAGAGEVNDLTISGQGQSLSIKDANNAITGTDGSAYCFNVDANTIRCDDAALTSLRLDLGDGNDAVLVSDKFKVLTNVDAGVGDDSITLTPDARNERAARGGFDTTPTFQFDGGAGADSVRLDGSFAIGGGYWIYAFDGGADVDSLVLHGREDSHGLGFHADTATDTWKRFERFEGHGTSRNDVVSAAGFTNVEFNLRGGNDTFGLSYATGPARPTKLTGGPGTDTFTVRFPDEHLDDRIRVYPTSVRRGSVRFAPMSGFEKVAVLTGPGNDTLWAYRPGVKMLAGPGADRFVGSMYADLFFGDLGVDVASGGGGDDLLDGELGDDRLFGGPGHDRLFGGAGNDALFGGLGNDRLHGGAGVNQLVGGPGADIPES